MQNNEEIIPDLGEEFLLEVFKLAQVGLTDEQMRLYFGIPLADWSEMLKRYPRLKFTLSTGRVRTVARVAQKLQEKIEEGNLNAIIFYLKSQAGWSDDRPEATDGSKMLEIPDVSLKAHDPLEAAKVYQSIMGN